MSYQQHQQDYNVKPYMYGESHITTPSHAIQIYKGKAGDNQVFQAMMMDPNVEQMHVVLSGLTDTVGAHKNLQHYIERHVDNGKTYHVYHAPNHLHEKEHHETKFLTTHEDGRPVQINTPQYNFYQDLQGNLERNKPVWLYSSAPTELAQLNHIAQAVRAKGGYLHPIHLSVGHNSQQFHPDRNQKLATELHYLNNAQNVIRHHLPDSTVFFHNSRMSFPDPSQDSVSRTAEETKDLFHPTTQKQAEQDIFFGPTIKDVHKKLHNWLEPKGLEELLPNPHPPQYKNEDFEDATQDMLTTYGKQDSKLEKVQRGREHLLRFLQAAPPLMQAAIDSGDLSPDEKRKMGKRLGRMGGNKFARKFQGSDPLPVEMGDPIALAAHRQALHNPFGEGYGPHYKPIAFRTTQRGNIGEPAGNDHDEFVGYGLFGADANEALEDHKYFVKNGNDVAYIPNSGYSPRNNPSSSDGPH